MAEICEKYLSKGDKIYCEGRLKTRQWEQEGQKRYATEIHVVDMTFLTTKKETVKQENPSEKTEAPNNQVEENDDLPF